MKTISITRLTFVVFAINLMLLLTTTDEQRRSGVRRTSAPPIRGTASVPRAGTVVRNRIGMELVSVPAGSFMMGSENGSADEKPVHQVAIREGFYMGRYEVTQAQWRQVIGSNPSHFKGDNLPVD